jgi:transcriptional regulator with XRE-family HTH domain
MVMLIGGQMTKLVLPSQIRAARALLDWSQEELASACRLGLSTIKDFEAGRRDPAPENMSALWLALERSGIQFIPLDRAGGPGVRFLSEIPKLVSRPRGVDLGTDKLLFKVRWRGIDVAVFLPPSVLDDLDKAEHEDNAAYEASFRRHEVNILQKTALALYAGRLDDRMRLHLRSRDFFPY